MAVVADTSNEKETYRSVVVSLKLCVKDIADKSKTGRYIGTAHLLLILKSLII